MNVAADNAESLNALTPMELADLLLLEVVARGHGSMLLRPSDTEYAICFEGENVAETIALIDAELAQHTLRRLALIAGQSLMPPQVERIRIRLASHGGSPDAGTIEVLLSLRPSRQGDSAELIVLNGTQALDTSSTVVGIVGVANSGRGTPKYEVISELGRGGMGIVYLARHVALDKQVALKVLSPAMAQRQTLAAQFVVEARAACRARHPAVIDVTDFGRLADGRNFLVMEYIAWPTLADVLQKGAVATHRALRLARAIAEGLGAAHAHGVVHRDLKPANIFVGDNAQVKVADFGLAQTTEISKSETNLEGLCFGTVPYMAPEQSLGLVVDNRADIYAFGCILYELLTGATPFVGDDSQEILEAHRSTPPPSLPDLGAFPERLQALQSSLLRKSPADRPADLASVIAELDACLEAIG